MERDLHPYINDCALLIIYEYSPLFMRAYLEFLDNMVKIFNRHNYNGDDVPGDYFSVTQLVELLIDRHRPQNNAMALEEHAIDCIFDDFSEEMANDVIEEMTDFLNQGIYPAGMQEIAKTLDEALYLIEIVFDAEHDATYYCFENANA
jgi:hypothetical protein